MNVLMLSKDPALFDPNGLGDARARHARYARALRGRCGETASLRIVSLVGAAGFHPQNVAAGFRLIPTRPPHRALYLCGAALRVLGELRGWRPDLVTAQEAWEEGLLGWLVARLVGARFLAQLHTDIFSSGWRRQAGINSLKTAIAVALMKRSDAIRVVSSSQKKNLIAHGVDERKIRVTPYSITMEPLPSTADPSSPLVLFVGRFSPEKNLPLWIRVAERVAREFPSSRFAMLGDGPGRPDVEAMVERCGLARRFDFPGKVDYADLPAWYARASALLLTSDYEGLPRVAVEAMRSGVPVVSTACPGIADAVDDGRTGWICEHGDEGGLAKRLAALLLDPVARYRMGVAARERMRDFSEEVVTGRLMDCWQWAVQGDGTCDCCSLT